MKYLISILALVISVLSFGQRPDKTMTSPKGNLSGNVIDATTQEPIPYATVTVKRVKDSTLVSGGLTSEDGTFAITDITPGEHFAEISFIGYDKKDFGPFVFSPKEKMNYVITDAQLGLNEAALDEVVVTGVRDAVRYEVDKKVYDASQIKSAEGGTARDVLEQIPSITINADQTLELRGSSNIRVLINGRPSTLELDTILEQIPQKDIKDIEIITNPSAKYDAEGEVGIVNIILKTNDLTGFTGGVNASVGTEDKYNGGVNFAYKVNKWNLSTNLGYRHFEDEFIRNYDLVLKDDPSTYQSAKNTREFLKDNANIRLGVDYYLDDNNTIFLTGGFNDSNDEDYNIGINQNVRTSLFNGIENIPSNFYDYNRIGDGSEEGNRYNISGAFQHLFNGDMQHNLLIDAQYRNSEDTEPTLYSIDQFIASDGTIVSGFDDFTEQDRERENITISADYTNPISETVKLEAGLKTTIDTSEENFLVKYGDALYEKDSGVFDFDQTVTAGYFTYQNQINEIIGLKGGLRAEHVDVSSIATGGQTNTYEDNYISFFPSASASYKVDEDFQLTSSYSRRVSRPRGRQLNPFANRSDVNNIFVGNNTLKPQFTDSFELGFNKYFGSDLGVDGAFYFRKLKDQIQFVSTFDEQLNATKTSFYNLSEQNSLGIESSFDIRPSAVKWYSARLTGNYNYQKVLENDSVYQLNTDAYDSFNARITNNFVFPKSIRAGLVGSYTSPNETYLGNTKARWSMNANASMRVLDNKGSIFIRSNDIFNTSKFEVTVEDDIRIQNREINWPSQMTFVGFSYNFGNLKRGETRKKIQRKNDEYEGGNDQQMEM